MEIVRSNDDQKERNLNDSQRKYWYHELLPQGQKKGKGIRILSIQWVTQARTRTNGLWKLDRLSPEAPTLTALFTVQWWNSSEWLCWRERMWKLLWRKQRDSYNKASSVVDGVIYPLLGLALILQSSGIKRDHDRGFQSMRSEQKVINSLHTFKLQLVIVAKREIRIWCWAALILCDKQLGITPIKQLNEWKPLRWITEKNV